VAVPEGSTFTSPTRPPSLGFGEDLTRARQGHPLVHGLWQVMVVISAEQLQSLGQSALAQSHVIAPVPHGLATHCRVATPETCSTHSMSVAQVEPPHWVTVISQGNDSTLNVWPSQTALTRPLPAQFR